MRLADLDEVFRLDRDAFGDDRSFFLERRLALYPRFAKVLDRGDSLAGFVLGFQGRGAVAAGPWVVRPEVERPVMLLESFALETGEFPVVIGLLETNARAAAALSTLPYIKPRRPSWRMILAASDDPARLGNSPLCWAVGSAAKG